MILSKSCALAVNTPQVQNKPAVNGVYIPAVANKKGLIYLYIDNSNFYIEGMRVSAIKRGLADSVWDASCRKIFDFELRINFYNLASLILPVANSRGRALLCGSASRGTSDSPVFYNAQRAGFETMVLQRNLANKEKGVDIAISTEMMADAAGADPESDQLALVSGDADFVPIVEKLVSRGFFVKVLFWKHAASELKAAASEFIPLDGHMDFLMSKTRTAPRKLLQA